MVIFEPCDDPVIDSEITQGTPEGSEETAQLLMAGTNIVKQMWKFKNTFNPADVANITQKFDTGIQYKGKGQLKNPKRKGGGNSAEASLVDNWVDFCSAMDNHRYADAIPLYFMLNRLASGEGY